MRMVRVSSLQITNERSGFELGSGAAVRWQVVDKKWRRRFDDSVFGSREPLNNEGWREGGVWDIPLQLQ